MNDVIPGCRVKEKVLFHGKNIYDQNADAAEVRKKIGMVFQKTKSFPKSIYENVAYGQRVAGIKSNYKLDEIVERSLKKLLCG